MSVTRKIISTPNAPSAIGPYSQAVQVDNTLYISGQLGLDPKTMNFIDDTDDFFDVQKQAKQALENMGAILAAAGSSFDNVVKTTVLLKDIKDFSKVNEIYATFFKTPYPARAAYECANLPKYGLVEIEAIAIVGDIKDE